MFANINDFFYHKNTYKEMKMKINHNFFVKLSVNDRNTAESHATLNLLNVFCTHIPQCKLFN